MLAPTLLTMTLPILIKMLAFWTEPPMIPVLTSPVSSKTFSIFGPRTLTTRSSLTVTRKIKMAFHTYKLSVEVLLSRPQLLRKILHFRNLGLKIILKSSTGLVVFIVRQVLEKWEDQWDPSGITNARC